MLGALSAEKRRLAAAGRPEPRPIVPEAKRARRLFSRTWLTVLILRQRAFCPLCNEHLPADETLIEIDHVDPIWAGGSDALENLQAVHGACHKKKTAGEQQQRHAEQMRLEAERRRAAAPRRGP